LARVGLLTGGGFTLTGVDDLLDHIVVCLNQFCELLTSEPCRQLPVKLAMKTEDRRARKLPIARSS
jgi:hypothetical protein